MTTKSTTRSQGPQQPNNNPQQPEIAPAKSPHIDIPQPDSPPPQITPPEQPVPVKG